MERKIKVLIAKPGLDGHDMGAKLVAFGLRDRGMEVIYTGIRQTPDQIVQVAIEEDVDVVGLGSLSGAHKYTLPRVAELLSEAGFRPLLIAGGIIPSEDIPFLKERGIDEIFGPGTPVQSIIDYITAHVRGETKVEHL
jgi:methylmalonyl-CoA mutase C-terminal domain/subunit